MNIGGGGGGRSSGGGGGSRNFDAGAWSGSSSRGGSSSIGGTSSIGGQLRGGGGSKAGSGSSARGDSGSRSIDVPRSGGGSSGGSIITSGGERSGRSGDGSGKNRNLDAGASVSGGNRDGGRSDRSGSTANVVGSNPGSSGGGSKDRNSDSVRSLSANSGNTGFLDKHGGKQNNKQSDKQGKYQLASNTTGGSSATAAKSGRDKSIRSSTPPLNVKDLHDHGNQLHDHATDTFLHKHGGRKLHDHTTGDFLRVRNDGTLRNLGWRGGHHGHHHGSNSAFFFALGGPFSSFGFGSPYWGWGFNPWGYGYGYGGYWGRPYWGGYGWGGYGWGGYGWGGYGGFWPYCGFGWPGYGFGWPYGSLSIGYASRNFGLLYNTGYGWPGYGYWPSYQYDPYCVYPSSRASYIVTSPSYAALPSESTTITTEPAATDASAARIEPIPITPPANPVANFEPDPVASEQARDFAREGEAAFKQSDYKGAIRAWRHALLDDPQNGTLVLMLAQAHFQVGEYEQAAGATQQAMMALPKDKWGVVVQNYEELYGKSKIKEYTEQLKALEKAVADKPKDPARRFLVGYHFLFLGYPKEAMRELTVLREIAKQDKAGEELFKLAEEELKKKESSSVPPSNAPKSESSDAPPAEVPKKPDGQ
jgi:hypothetical protein